MKMNNFDYVNGFRIKSATGSNRNEVFSAEDIRKKAESGSLSLATFLADYEPVGLDICDISKTLDAFKEYDEKLKAAEAAKWEKILTACGIENAKQISEAVMDDKPIEDLVKKSKNTKVASTSTATIIVPPTATQQTDGSEDEVILLITENPVAQNQKTNLVALRALIYADENMANELFDNQPAVDLLGVRHTATSDMKDYILEVGKRRAGCKPEVTLKPASKKDKGKKGDKNNA